MSEHPLYQDSVCYGLSFGDVDLESIREKKQIDLHWLFEFYNAYPDKKIFFDASRSNQIGNFDKLAGTYLAS